MKTGKLLVVLVCLLTMFFSIAMADNIVVAFEKREYSILAGKTDTIRPVVQGTKSKGKFSYSSSDESIATVKNGQIKGVAPGDATINCSVTISEKTFNTKFPVFT